MSTIGSDSAFSRTKLCNVEHLRTVGGRDWEHIKNERYKVSFCFTKVLAKGGFGVVYLGHRQYERENHEIKIQCKEENIAFKDMQVNDSEKGRVEREIEVHKRLGNSCENIVKPISKKVFKATSQYVIAMEYCSGGDLEKYSIDNKKLWSEVEAKNIIRSVVSGLKHLKEFGYFHRDIKPKNVFIAIENSRLIFKLGDFGLAAKIDECNTIEAGTRSYMAPEIDGTRKYDCKVDIWSLGKVLQFILIGSSSKYAIQYIGTRYIFHKLSFLFFLSECHLVSSLCSKKC